MCPGTTGFGDDSQNHVDNGFGFLKENHVLNANSVLPIFHNPLILPATVISRCQRLELRPLAADEVEAALVGRWGVEPQQARLVARLSHGCVGWAVSAVSDGGLLQQRTERMNSLLDIIDADYEERFASAARLAAEFGRNRASVQQVLAVWLDWWRDLLLTKAGCGGAVVNVDLEGALAERAEVYSLAEIKTIIDGILAVGGQLRQNANPRLALEVLMLTIPRKEGRGGVPLTAR